MTPTQRILIVEDYSLLRAGLRALLSQDAHNEIVGELDHGCDAARSIETHAPHLVLLDLTVPDRRGIDTIVEIKRRLPGVRVIILTPNKTDAYIQESLRAGADGYVLRDASDDELRVAIRSVLSGKIYLSPEISTKLVNGYLAGGRASKLTSVWETVTPRERQVLRLIAEGRSNRYIAELFQLSVKTVEKHRSNLMKKLDLHNAASLTAFAIEQGLVTRDPGPLPSAWLSSGLSAPRESR